jgi:hypothetical protein
MFRTLAVTISAVSLLRVVAFAAGTTAEQTAPAGSSAPRPAPPTPAMNAADAAAIEQFKRDIQAYVEIHTAAEKALPKLPTEATIQQIDANQRLLLQAIAKSRSAARRGDLFKPGMEAMLRRVMARVFEGIEGRQLRESIMEENPTNIRIAVNGRYPDTVPLATMPPDVLAALPTMPEELEYRFIGSSLAIMDVHAHMIVDFAPNVLPR